MFSLKLAPRGLSLRLRDELLSNSDFEKAPPFPIPPAATQHRDSGPEREEHSASRPCSVEARKIERHVVCAVRCLRPPPPPSPQHTHAVQLSVSQGTLSISSFSSLSNSFPTKGERDGN